jgi:hypothetical protein
MSDIMSIGPLEYVVINVPDGHIDRALCAELNRVHANECIRVVDFVVVTKAAYRATDIREVDDLRVEARAACGHFAHDLIVMLTAEDIHRVVDDLPSDTTAMVVLLEHTWVIGLTEAIRSGGGEVLAGGMASHQTMARLNDDLNASPRAVSSGFRGRAQGEDTPRGGAQLLGSGDGASTGSPLLSGMGGGRGQARSSSQPEPGTAATVSARRPRLRRPSTEVGR